MACPRRLINSAVPCSESGQLAKISPGLPVKTRPVTVARLRAGFGVGLRGAARDEGTADARSDDGEAHSEAALRPEAEKKGVKEAEGLCTPPPEDSEGRGVEDRERV
jgi:hypothetical protein